MRLSIVSDHPYVRRLLHNGGQNIPPFAERKIIRRDDPSYEDAVFNFRFGSVIGESRPLAGIDEANDIINQMSPLRNMPINSVEFDKSINTMHGIKPQVASILSHNEDGYYDCEDKIEIWMIYDPSEDLGVKPKLIAATCNLPESPTAKIYANTDYRGNIFIPEKSISPPLYFWEEAGLGRDVLILVQGDYPAMVVNTPEEMEHFAHFEAPQDMSEVEKAVMEHFRQQYFPNVPSDFLKHEPNGEKTFPDYEICGSPISFEITTLRDGMSDRLMNIDKGWGSLKKIETVYRKDEARQALHRAVNEKAKKATDVPMGYDYVLIIVSEFFPLHRRYSIWEGLDLSPFSEVVIANKLLNYKFDFELVLRRNGNVAQVLHTQRRYQKGNRSQESPT